MSGVLSISGIRAFERVLILFFVYLALYGWWRSIAREHRLVLALLPVAVIAFCLLESRNSRPWSRILREWSSLAFILIAYWSLGLFASNSPSPWQSEWLDWDRALLYKVGLKQVLESGGPLLPFTLETIYLLLYAIPPAALGLAWFLGARRHSHRLLLVLFSGTFSAYALLPVFPVQSPRVISPGADLPAYSSSVRTLNTWLLDNMDIATGVFPSGHVAVAFSSAFGLLTVFRRRRRVWVPAFIVAAFVYLATIYGRYHYSVDGLASITITSVAWRVSSRWNS